jgi:hypothetical protein
MAPPEHMWKLFIHSLTETEKKFISKDQQITSSNTPLLRPSIMGYFLIFCFLPARVLIKDIFPIIWFKFPPPVKKSYGGPEMGHLLPPSFLNTIFLLLKTTLCPLKGLSFVAIPFSICDKN